MSDYSRMNKAELIERLRALEQEMAASPTNSVAEASRHHESSERLRAILETAVEGIITIDERGIIESLNPAAESIFGYTAQELMGKNVSTLMPSPYREQHDRYLQNYLATSQARIIGIGREVVGLRKDGTIFPMDLSVSEVRLAQRRLFTGFVRDITERKRLEKEVLEISETERRRIGQDLHDGICQHLAGIELKSEVLEQHLKPRSKSLAAEAATIARHVREVIGQTRSLARGLSPVVLEEGGLTAALQELASTVEELFPVRCQLSDRRSAPRLATVAATHLYRVAQEAIANAVRHGKATEIHIQLRTNNQGMEMEIQDNGSGFQTGHAIQGMGLRIMSYRAAMLGGAIRVESQPQRGTRIICEIPTLSPVILQPPA